MASISPLNTYKEQSNLYDAVAEKDANYVGKQIHAARKDLKISLEQFSQRLLHEQHLTSGSWAKRFQVHISSWLSALRCIWRMALIIL